MTDTILTTGQLAQADVFKAIAMADMAMRAAIAEFGEMPGWEGRRGAFFCARHVQDPCPFLTVRLGDVRQDKAEKYRHFSQEKAKRLAANFDIGHVSSWQSQNEAEEKYPGAVRMHNLMFSLSGFPGLGDEAICLAALCLFRNGSSAVIDQARKIAALSNNPYFRKLLVALMQRA